jgi:allantoicase/malate synthase/CubicO group peptidase (beta-lactamase class C family)
MTGREGAHTAEIPSYRDYISAELIDHLRSQLVPVLGADGLLQLGTSSGLESQESLHFLCDLYHAVKLDLASVLRQRVTDRAFIDQRTRACFELNAKLQVGYGDPGYRTVIGQEDIDGRVVIGPLSSFYCRAGSGAPIAPIPEFLQGSHVTLFGPPDDAKLSINAMNAFHRTLPGEPEIVAELLKDFSGSAKWGADDEDSKTPLRADLVLAGENLTGCLQGTISYDDPRSGKEYRLAASHRSVPIKRFPGLALPCPFLYLHGNPLPLHLYDFALHLFANWNNPQALAFYVPKLETEEEAAYIRVMLERAERLIAARHPEYRVGTIRLLIVLENPRAMFRVNEIMDALYPYFSGASLGWHDFLASTARLMKNDGNYRIPVKADPGIVINYIKASHDLLAQVVGSRGGIKVGGMYGVLPADGDIRGASFQVAIKGFIKDVITQMKRDLSGFWVAHPDFVRLGLALVEAWKRSQHGNGAALDSLVTALLLPEHQREVLDFIHGSDVRGLDRSDPLYPRSLLVADRNTAGFVANNDPEEIRYNVFQALQYLTDWLSGNGCVALPANIDGVPVRVMDDLATAERSRWEVWHELHHGRFSCVDFMRIAHEEMHFIRKDLSDQRKIVQVKWDDRTRKWYPVAMNLMLQLMGSESPVEFATELLLPFTLDAIRTQDDPWAAMQAIEPTKYAIPKRLARLHAFFSACGSRRFAEQMALDPVLDLGKAERLVRSFDIHEINEAAHFHGDIGEAARTLDATAAQEQAKVLGGAAEVAQELRALGSRYRERFGFKFLVAAKGRTGTELLGALRTRIEHSHQVELEHAREALWQITKGRLLAQPVDTVFDEIAAALARHGVKGASVCVASPGNHLQSLQFGHRDAIHAVTPQTGFEIASLSKSIGTCFVLEQLRKAGVPISASVNALLAKAGSKFRVRSLDAAHPEWADQVTVAHLMSHQGLNMHYVNGVPANEEFPPIVELLNGNERHGYEPVGVVNAPGTRFQYSGGGFLVLQHLIECMGGAPVHVQIDAFLRELGMDGCTFREDELVGVECATGFLDSGEPVIGTRKVFPAIAAGAVASAADVARFLVALSNAHQSINGCGPISHETAVRMLHGSDRGCRDFMGCNMGLGMFTAEAGPNRLAIHQGSNDGFRALFVHCYAGPDAGNGFVVLCNGEHAGMLFVAEAAQIMLRHMGMCGVDTSQFRSDLAFGGIPLEQRVNAGYRELVFAAFAADLPEEIGAHGPRDPLATFNHVVGARVEAVSNQRFARAENLLSPYLPTFDPALFGRQGKIMDSWETVRHNPEPFDWMIFEMQRATAVSCVAVSTQFHLGNHAEGLEIDGWDAARGEWQAIVAPMQLYGHAAHVVESISGAAEFRRIRVRMYPDGGVTRLALYGADLPAAEKTRMLSPAICAWPTFDPRTKKPMTPKYTTTAAEVAASIARVGTGLADLASTAFGGQVVSASNEHYSPATQVISPYPPLSMVDGLESARSREPGHSENVVIRLGRPAKIGRIELDFSHFINNNPREVAIDGLCGTEWIPLVARTEVKAFAGNIIDFELGGVGPCEQIRVTVFPDGGMNRVRVFAAP